MGKFPFSLHFPFNLHYPINLHYPSVGKLVKVDKRNAKPANLGQVQAVLNGLRMTAFETEDDAIAAGYNNGDLYITPENLVACVVNAGPAVAFAKWIPCDPLAGLPDRVVNEADQILLLMATEDSDFFSIAVDEVIQHYQLSEEPIGAAVVNFTFAQYTLYSGEAQPACPE